MSVESLERAHREESRTPPFSSVTDDISSTYGNMPPIPPKATPASDLESDLKSKLHISPAVSKKHHKESSDIEYKGAGVSKQEMNNGTGKKSYAGATKSPLKRTQVQV